MNDEPVVPPPGAPTEQFAVVGLGASAGGIQALLEFFGHTSPNASMAYVVVVHLSPEHESRIGELLQQATAMPVQVVNETLTLAAGHVYVISPRTQLRMVDGKVEPVPPPPKRTGAMTIDLFLETLATAHTHRAIGIVLSGTGSDGTRGIRAVKANGGVTLAQAPEEAEYDAMPRNAIASGAVDFVLHVADMPDKIDRLWRNARAIEMPELPERPAPEDGAAEAEEALRDILSALRTRTGHDFSQYKRPTLLRRIERRLQVNQVRSLPAYRQLLSEQPSEAQALLRDLLISVTWFFRDPDAWQVVGQRIIPELLRGREDGTVRAWVVGCATGEEVYSLGMLFQEAMDLVPNAPKVSIFATDIDEDALQFARAGLYPETIAENVSAERLRRFFVREQSCYRVSKQLREMMMFAAHNIIQDPPFSRVDLVCCRNLLIYLTRHVQSKVLDLLHFSLRPDGYLFLGMSESVEDGHDGFMPLDKTHRIFSQQPRTRMGLMLGSLPMVQTPIARLATDAASAAGRRLVSYGELHQRLLEHYAPPSLVVDDRYDIVHLSDHAGLFLQFGPGEPSVNLLKVAPDELRFDLKAVLDEAMQSMRTVERRQVSIKRGLQVTPVDVNVHPVRDKASGRTFALVIFDPNAGERDAPTIDATAVRTPESTLLEKRLHDLEAQLRAAVEQYEVQNEELKASNEELQATNEELRATTEELETGKEELQSINEELTTVNQELKNKVDEATRISDDLQNFITATEIASLFVDRELRLMRYTPLARQVFNVIPSDIGRPLLDITHRLEGIDLGASIEQVFQTLHLSEHEARSSDGHWYIVRFLPYRTTDDRIRGAVVTLIDITQRKAAEDLLRRSEVWSKLVMNSVRDYAIMTVTADGTIETWNDGAKRVFGWDPSEAIGQKMDILFTPEDRAQNAPAMELAKARDTGRAEDDRWQMCKDGHRIFVTGVTAPLEDPQQFGYVKLCRDITEQQRAAARRDELLAAERINRAAAEEASRLKDDFLAMLSHELRNPLALMLMQSEIILRAPETDQAPRLRQAARVIHEMVRSQAQLVEDMLDVSRARTGKLAIDRQLLPMSFVIADSIGAMRKEAEQKKIALDVHIGESPLIVTADPLRLRQIGWNLLSNAIKFTPAGGTVRVKLSREGKDARLDVEDTGQGMAPDVVSRVFDWTRPLELGAPGSQTGLGIGLALVRQLVELHGGRVEAFSEGVGKGSRFTVWLPLEVAANVPARLSAPKGNGSADRRLDGVRVLLVDDSEANGKALGELLELDGAKVVVVNSGPDARARADDQPFDVIVSDIEMPGGDGYALLRAVRAGGLNAATPAIAYSGYGSPKDVERARQAGFEVHITKPSAVEDIVAAIAGTAKRNGG